MKRRNHLLIATILLLCTTLFISPVSAQVATKLVFSFQPHDSIAGRAINIPNLGPTVIVQDSFGNTVTSSTASITIAIGTNPGGGTLSGTTSKNASGGVATFSDLSIDKAGTGYTLIATATGLTSATSNAFNITAAAAAKVAFTTPPTSTTAGSTLAGPPTVTVQDSFGNTVTYWTASITVAIGTNPGGGTLSGTTTKNAASGVASFTDLSINLSGTGYTLTAASAGLTAATSNAFNIISAVTGGTIAGIVSRASDGLPIGAALVEVLQANAVRAITGTGTNGSYSVSGLPAGTYGVRASAANFAAQQQNGVAVSNGGTSPANFSLNAVPGLQISITSPVDDKFVERSQIWVFGQASAPAGIAQVTVNSKPAQANEGAFGAVLPVVLGLNAVTAMLVDFSGNVAIDTIIVTRQEPRTPDFIAIWDGIKNALRAGNIAGALEFIIEKSRERYQGIFTALGIQLSEIDLILTNINPIAVRQEDAEFEMFRSGRSFEIFFARDDDGIWRLASF